MGIEARGYEGEVGRKITKRRQDAIVHGLAELYRPGIGRQRRVHHIADALFIRRSRSGIVGELVGGGVEQFGIMGESCLGAVAVVDVEVDHGGACETVLLAGVQGPDGDVVEQTEAHGAGRFGMMSGGPDGAKGVLPLARHDRIHRGAKRAGGAKGGLAR